MNAQKKNAKRGAKGAAPSYKVVTVTELDVMVYEALVAEGAAERAGNGRYTITDKARAQSDRILPMVLNPLGKEGWRLTAVNKMECYIFSKGRPVEYKVNTPPEMDRLGLLMLEAEGHVSISQPKEGTQPEVEITSPSHARIQAVLPRVLGEIEQDGWSLATVSGPQLYFFTRLLK